MLKSRKTFKKELKKLLIKIIIASFVISAVLASFDFFAFKLSPQTAFYIHNSLAILIGAGLAYFSYILAKRKSGNNVLNYFIALTGAVMVIVHIAKMIIGVCV